MLQYLQPTNYIIKITEAQSIRDWNDKMKRTIINCSTIEQLNTIVIEYQGA
jgi:hypothetical protein